MSGWQARNIQPLLCLFENMVPTNCETFVMLMKSTSDPVGFQNSHQNACIGGAHTHIQITLSLSTSQSLLVCLKCCWSRTLYLYYLACTLTACGSSGWDFQNTKQATTQSTPVSVLSASDWIIAGQMHASKLLKQRNADFVCIFKRLFFEYIPIAECSAVDCRNKLWFEPIRKFKYEIYTSRIIPK